MSFDGWLATPPRRRIRIAERWHVFVVRHNYRMWWWRGLMRSMVVDYTKAVAR
jgi:hypothetical protein